MQTIQELSEAKCACAANMIACGNSLHSLCMMLWLKKWLYRAGEMLMYVFTRDITSRHLKSKNKCQPVFVLISGFPGEGNEDGEETRVERKGERSQAYIACAEWRKESWEIRISGVQLETRRGVVCGHWDKYQLLDYTPSPNAPKRCHPQHCQALSLDEVHWSNFKHFTHN